MHKGSNGRGQRFERENSCCTACKKEGNSDRKCLPALSQECTNGTRLLIATVGEMRPNGLGKTLFVIPEEGFVRNVDEQIILSGGVVLRRAHNELFDFLIELSATDR